MAYLFCGTNSYYFSLVVLVFLFISSSTTSADARELQINVKVTKSVVNEVCSQTRNPNLCLNVLSSDPRTETADLFGLCSISNNLAFINATKSLNFINYLVNIAVPEKKDHLRMCSLYYQNAVEDLKHAAERMGHSNYKVVNILATDVISKVNDCENVFQSPPVFPSPLTKWNKNLGDLADIVVVISKRLS
ncbi:Pectinesterase inhibitor domain [Macleaya cordata]|uniref:Pectinesterase inhibitor domain n=1 Tax=Macleaya cordata TaxID=56857 RepID=A0A200R1S7_MACCD|nr:Pectinesterase inhibitor domain [Macleaya cordata]